MKSVTNAIVYGEEHRNRNRAAGLCLGLGNMGVMDCGLVNMGVMHEKGVTNAHGVPKINTNRAIFFGWTV